MRTKSADAVLLGRAFLTTPPLVCMGKTLGLVLLMVLALVFLAATDRFLEFLLDGDLYLTIGLDEPSAAVLWYLVSEGLDDAFFSPGEMLST